MCPRTMGWIILHPHLTRSLFILGSFLKGTRCGLIAVIPIRLDYLKMWLPLIIFLHWYLLIMFSSPNMFLLWLSLQSSPLMETHLPPTFMCSVDNVPRFGKIPPDIHLLMAFLGNVKVFRQSYLEFLRLPQYYKL